MHPDDLNDAERAAWQAFIGQLIDQALAERVYPSAQKGGDIIAEVRRHFENHHQLHMPAPR